MKDTILRKMGEARLKLTPQRCAIVEVLVERTPFHPSANHIYREAKRKIKGLSLSTVYYTVDELSAHGIIKMLEFDKMENRYEGNITDHINLVCKGCKKIVDYKFRLSIDSKEVFRRARFWVTDSRLEYYGYCDRCKQK